MTSLLEKIKLENELRFFFQKESIYYVHYYPNILELQNKIASVKEKINSESIEKLQALKLELNMEYAIDYIEYYPSLFACKFLHGVKLTLKEHLRFNRELIPLYLKKETFSWIKTPEKKKSRLKIFFIGSTSPENRMSNKREYLLCIKRIERKEKNFPNLRME